MLDVLTIYRQLRQSHPAIPRRRPQHRMARVPPGEASMSRPMGLIKDMPGDWCVIHEQPHYAVSRSGEVFSLRRGRMRKLAVVKNTGYLQVNLAGQQYYRVHRLVATAFIPNPENKPEVNHIDGNPRNNHADNLEWCTRSENQLHAYATGLQPPKVWTAESIRKRTESRRGYVASEETRARMSASRRGKGTAPKSPEHRRKIAEGVRAARKAAA